MIDGIPAPGPSIFTILGHYWSEVFPLHLRTFFFWMKRCEVPVTAGSSRSTPSAPQQRHGMGSFFSWSGRWRRKKSTSKWGEGTLVMVSLPSSVGDDVMIPFLGETSIFQNHFFGWYRMISPHMTRFSMIMSMTMAVMACRWLGEVEVLSYRKGDGGPGPVGTGRKTWGGSGPEHQQGTDQHPA